MKKALQALLAVSAIVPSLALAQEAKSPWSLTGNVNLVSDYRYRGISQTYSLPAIQGGFDLGHSGGFYVGTWASNVSGNSYPGGNGMEWDLYGGYKLEVATDLNLDVGLLQYLYPAAKVPGSLKRFDTTEIYSSLSYANFTGKISYAISDFFGFPSSRGSWYADLSYAYPLTKTINLQAHVGRQYAKNITNGSYTDYKIGATAEAAGLTWGVALIGTNANEDFYTAFSSSDPGSSKKLGKTNVVLSVGKTF